MHQWGILVAGHVTVSLSVFLQAALTSHSITISLTEHAQLLSGKISSSCIMIFMIQCIAAMTKQTQPYSKTHPVHTVSYSQTKQIASLIECWSMLNACQHP